MGAIGGLRVASLRMLATDLWMQVESSSTVSNLFMGVTVRSRPTKGLNRVRMSPRDRTLDRSPSGVTWSEFGGVVPHVAISCSPELLPFENSGLILTGGVAAWRLPQGILSYDSPFRFR